MKLYIGGVHQGQRELALEENPGCRLYDDFHLTVWQAVQQGADPCAFAEQFCREHPQAIVTANEVGSGVVPLRAEDRAFREAAGRALCVVARAAHEVTRCVCGLGVRIK